MDKLAYFHASQLPTTMNTSEKLFASRVFVGAFTVCFMMIGYVVYTEYSVDIQNELFDALTKTFPNLDRELAGL